MKKTLLWSVEESDDGKLGAISLSEMHNAATEERLESLLVASPDLILVGLKLIGRQVTIEGGCLDLLGLDPDGRLIVLELKRGTLTRDAVAQILDYVSDLNSRAPEELAHLIEENSGAKGIEPIEDFSDWYAREYPDAVDLLDRPPKMILVGLGVDDRAKRIVSFLADAGIDIQLQTFHAFTHQERMFLARQVEVAASDRGTGKSGPTKEQNRRMLHELAEQHAALELLVTVADFIEERLPCYRWPGKTAYSFSLQDRGEDGRPSNRTYLTLYVHQRKRGAVFLTFARRAEDAAPQALQAFVGSLETATKDAWFDQAAQVDITSATWPEIRERLSNLLVELQAGWRRRMEQDEAGDEETEKRSSVAEPSVVYR